MKALKWLRWPRLLRPEPEAVSRPCECGVRSYPGFGTPYIYRCGNHPHDPSIGEQIEAGVQSREDAES